MAWGIGRKRNKRKPNCINCNMYMPPCLNTWCNCSKNIHLQLLWILTSLWHFQAIRDDSMKPTLSSIANGFCLIYFRFSVKNTWQAMTVYRLFILQRMWKQSELLWRYQWSCATTPLLTSWTALCFCVKYEPDSSHWCSQSLFVYTFIFIYFGATF